MLINISLLTGGLVLVVLGLAVLISNPKNESNQTLTLFTASGFLWLVANLVTNLSVSSQMALLFARLTLVGAALIPLSFILFCIAYIPTRKLTAKNVFIWSALPLVIILFTRTSLNIRSIGAYGVNARTGEIYYLLIAVLIAYFAYGIFSLWRFYKSGDSTPLQKTQLRYIFFGLILTFIPGFIANGLLPVLNYPQAASFGPTSVVFFALFTSLAILRHRFLDIRLIVARSVAYTLLLGTLGLLYGFAVFGASTLFFAGETVALRQQVVYAVLAVILAFTFQPLRRFFEKITDKIFYRDRYETQSVLNETSRVLAAEIDMKVITRETLKIISRNLKLRNSSFVTMDEGKIYKIDEYGAVAIGRLDRDQLKRIKHNILVTDELDETPLKHMLAEHKIAAILRLKTQSGVVGYLLLGPKESGNIYTSQDVELLEILSNELAVAVENARSFEKIADFNITLQQRIKEATAKLRTQNVKLKELDRAKDEFISMASHQLRTPLTTIKGYLSMMLEGDAGQLKGEQHKFTDAAFMSAQRMVYLISDMLNVSRISTGRLTFDMKPLDLAAVAREEVSQLKRTADAKNVKLHFNPPQAKLPKLSLDEGKIRQVMMNFIDNAIYYAPDTTVEVYLEKDGDKVRFRVRDRGIGVPKREQKNLFTKFYRAENAKQARPDGTGLGLYMAKMVTEAMGGQIIFESTKGRGSAFGFEYSISETQLQEPEAAAQAKPKDGPKAQAKSKKSTQVPIKSG